MIISLFFFNSFIFALFNYNNSLISIIVPIYNVNFYLKECLDSLINQKLKNIELICINDGSTDNSLEIIMNYIFDNRFILIDKYNSGYGDSMNNGLNFASGEYIGIVKSDDFVDINMYNTLYEYTKFGDIDIVLSNFIFYWDKNKNYVLNFKIINEIYNKIFNPIELGIGPNPQSPIPNPQSPIPNLKFKNFFFFLYNY